MQNYKQIVNFVTCKRVLAAGFVNKTDGEKLPLRMLDVGIGEDIPSTIQSIKSKLIEKLNKELEKIKQLKT